MPKWTKPDEALPECEVGDRIVVIVVERVSKDGPVRPSLVILEATETGWYSLDDLYSGYGPEDGVLWSTERDICQIAEIVQ